MLIAGIYELASFLDGLGRFNITPGSRNRFAVIRIRNVVIITNIIVSFIVVVIPRGCDYGRRVMKRLLIVEERRCKRRAYLGARRRHGQQVRVVYDHSMMMIMMMIMMRVALISMAIIMMILIVWLNLGRTKLIDAVLMMKAVGRMRMHSKRCLVILIRLTICCCYWMVGLDSKSVRVRNVVLLNELTRVFKAFF